VLKGTYRHRIDAKGRLPIPAGVRHALGEEGRVVVTQLDQCLAIYAPADWAKLESQLAALPSFSKSVKGLTRLLTSRAADCEIDRQGRILLPPALRAAAHLERDALVVGVLDRLEVWSPDAWASFVRDAEGLLDDVSLGVEWPLLPAVPARAEGPAPPTPSPGGHPQRKPNS
jgi:MraZ protein